MDDAGRIRYDSPVGRWVLGVTVLGSGIAFLEATVVNVALPAIGADLDADLAGLQWTINGYLLTLAALILLGGSLGDRYGRRRIFNLGVVWFVGASALCAVAPSIEVLIAARIVQGIGGALLTPGSLAIIEASFHPDDRGRAIGAWSALGGVAAAVGPLVGGWLIEAVSWRAIFLINIPLGAFVVWAANRHVPETRDPTISGRLDFRGSAFASLALAGLTFGVIQAPENGLGSPAVIGAIAVGLASAVAFVRAERRSPEPMLPLSIFDSRQFTSANLVTFVVYAALGGVFFLLVVFLQVALGYSPIAAGAASLPVTALMLVLSPRAGALAQRIGPRLPLTLGPILIAIGMLLMTRDRPRRLIPRSCAAGGRRLRPRPVAGGRPGHGDGPRRRRRAARRRRLGCEQRRRPHRRAGGRRGPAPDRRALRRRLREPGRDHRWLPRRRAGVRDPRFRRRRARLADDLQRRSRDERRPPAETPRTAPRPTSAAVSPAPLCARRGRRAARPSRRANCHGSRFRPERRLTRAENLSVEPRPRERPFAPVESRVGFMPPSDRIAIAGARAHNLKGIDLELPRDALIVITGLSGSGKSSLAFDTIYAEGQRRYVESLSAYARQFLGQMEKPDVDSIEGLSPAISIDQKTTSRNPRSTVGTVTEIYDYLRLLWARIGKPHCYNCGAPISGQSLEQITDRVLTLADGTRFMVMAPVVRGRKGEYGRLLDEMRAQGYARARVDGELRTARRVDRARQEVQARDLDRGRPPGDEGGGAKAPLGVGRGCLAARRRPGRGGDAHRWRHG